MLGGIGRVQSELQGLRGSKVLTKAKLAFAHAVGRAFYYDHTSAALEYALSKHVQRGRPLVYYEFGTGGGNTLQRALSVLREFDNTHVVLFDSFEGLPDASSPRDAHVGWKTGDFAFSEDYIRGIITKNEFPLERVRFVKGFFEKSLTQELAEELKATPPAFVTVDVDYYSSTRTVLDWLAPLLVSGSTFYFDDLWSFDGHPEFGQLKALSEFNELNKKRGQLVQNAIFNNRIYSYFNWDYEFVKGS
jgi:hypothetical protein